MNSVGKTVVSPVSPEAHRKRKRAGAKNTVLSEPHSPAFALPPPPTRSRTIIQMQPGLLRNENSQSSDKATEKGKAGGSKKATSGAVSGGKRAARKTAHSVIEKRRRSKMNEEFETMKEMIPACKGQTMHKLAILQAGIEYLRYLEQCVAELKISNSRSTPLLRPGPRDATTHEEEQSDAMEEDTSENGSQMDGEEDDHPADEDDDDHETALSSGPDTPRTDTSHYHHSTVSGEMSWSVTTASLPVSPNLSATAPSPLMSAHGQPHHLRPQTADAHDPRAADIEATAALLMLNGDRRSQSGSTGARGLSVLDLLSSS
jgi:Helix-loop-helix DNA-binding domain